MFWKYLLTFIFSLISVTMSKPQLITFKDGKIGVNFLGFSADAGLGGFLTGNAAHGGLSASAGTPFGQRAAAGIGGYNGDGGTYGGAFAGATAGQGVSARAGLGGVVGGGGVLGAESSAGGLTSGVIKTVGTVKETSVSVAPAEVVFDKATIDDEPQDVNVIQKIKSPKKYYGDNINDAELQLDIDTRFIKNADELPQIPNKGVTITKTIGNEPVQPAFNGIIKTKIIGTKTVSNIEPQTDTIVKKVDNNQVTLAAAVPEPIPTQQVFTYQKHKHPLRRRLHVNKQFVPFVYQYQNPSVVEFEKRHQVVAAPVEYSKVKTTVFAAPAAAAEKPQASNVHQHSVTAEGTVNAQGFFDGIFNIPISTLRAVNDFLNRGFGQGSLSVRKTYDVQTQAH